ncbi:hypothetical protein [Pyrococcus kukulkanii]|uniref:Uncharacterized protein n=1 Tax=Pyrococcus kukulkanii TaxID=1609559 RepID=A0ABV4T8Y2_9EURY
MLVKYDPLHALSLAKNYFINISNFTGKSLSELLGLSVEDFGKVLSNATVEGYAYFLADYLTTTYPLEPDTKKLVKWMDALVDSLSPSENYYLTWGSAFGKVYPVVQGVGDFLLSPSVEERVKSNVILVGAMSYSSENYLLGLNTRGEDSYVLSLRGAVVKSNPLGKGYPKLTIIKTAFWLIRDIVKLAELVVTAEVVRAARESSEFAREYDELKVIAKLLSPRKVYAHAFTQEVSGSISGGSANREFTNPYPLLLKFAAPVVRDLVGGLPEGLVSEFEHEVGPVKEAGEGNLFLYAVQKLAVEAPQRVKDLVRERVAALHKLAEAFNAGGEKVVQILPLLWVDKVRDDPTFLKLRKRRALTFMLLSGWNVGDEDLLGGRAFAGKKNVREEFVDSLEYDDADVDYIVSYYFASAEDFAKMNAVISIARANYNHDKKIVGRVTVRQNRSACI